MKKVFLCYDNTQDINSLVHERLVDLNNFYHYSVQGWTFDSTDNLHNKLNELADSQVDFVVVSALGNFLRLSSIDDAVINDCINHNAPLAGHLLDRKDYYCIDPQFFCLNIKVWDQIGRPRFERKPQRTTFSSVAVVRSRENFHDGYTPLWIKPTADKQDYTLDFLDFGTHAIYKFLDNGYTLININQDIRNRKYYLYPDYNADELTELFTTWNTPSEIPVKQYYDVINWQFDNYDRTVYILNSEDVMVKIPSPIDHYSGVCGGLKAVGILYNNKFKDTTRVSLFDISQPALDYQKYIVEHWDGNFDNYLSVFEKYKQDHPDLTYAWRSWNSWETEIDRFLQSAHMTREQFYDTWQRYIKLEIDYTCINLLDIDQVQQYFGSFNSDVAKSYYVWISNSYFMEHTIARYGTNWLKQRSDNLVDTLKKLNGRVRLEDERGLNRL